MHLGTSIAAVQAKEGRVRLTLHEKSGAGSTLEVAHVIAATGYRPAIKRLPFLDDDLRSQIGTADEAPVLNRCFECSVPGLYWVGLASANSFGPLARFAYGARFAARRLARVLVASLRADAEAPVPAPSASTLQ